MFPLASRRSRAGGDPYSPPFTAPPRTRWVLAVPWSVPAPRFSCGDLGGAAKGMGRKFRRNRGPALEPLGRNEDVALDLQDARERGIAGRGSVAREARVAHELLRLVERDAAAASGERSHPAGSDD